MRKILIALVTILVAACSSEGPSHSDHPVLLTMTPNASYPSGRPTLVVVGGLGFQQGAVVTWNGAELVTQFVSSTRLEATIAAQMLAAPDTALVTVRNPDGGKSQPLPFKVAIGALGFGIDSTRPTNGEEINVDEPLRVYFNEALDPAFIADSIVTIRDGATEIPATVTYLAGSRSISITAALAPLTRYEIDVNPTFRSLEGGILTFPVTTVVYSTFHSMVRLSPVAGSLSLAIGTDDHPRLAFTYSDLAGTTAYPALGTCSANCANLAGWTVGAVSSSPSAGYLISLALLNNSPKMTWASGSLIYLAGTVETVVDPGNSDISWPSIATSSGRLHIAYYAGGTVKHATCLGTCSQAADWAISVADPTGNSGAYSDIGVDGSGTVHTSYIDNAAGDLRYARCTAQCAVPDWQATIVDSAGRVGVGADMVVEANGIIHVVYLDQTRGFLRYARCAAGCDTSSNWATSDIVDLGAANLPLPNYQAAIAVNGNQIDVAYYRLDTKLLYGASCTGNCNSTSSWQNTLLSIQPSGDLGASDLSLGVDATGKRHVAWGNAGVKYMQY